MRYLIGIDLGTSGTKTVIFQEDGVKLASATVEYPLLQPQNGWAEQHPEDWWSAVCETLHSVMEESKIEPKQVSGIGISGQMHGLVLLDESGEVLRPAILWCDGRTMQECEEITQRVGREKLIQITANPALVGFTAGKILWVRKNEPELYARCRHILLPKDFIRFKLTGVFATEVSDASGTNLLDVPHRCWSKEILDRLEIDPVLLPPVYESVVITGAVSADAAALTGLSAGIPVVGGAGDNAAAAIGTGVVLEGTAFTTLGTSGVIFAHSDRVTIDPKGRVHTFCAAVPGAWAVMSCTLSAGMSLRWFRDVACASECFRAEQQGCDPYMLMDESAKMSPIGSNRLLFLPYLMGERSPLLDEKARGAFVGLSGMHTRGDMIRAVMEGVAFSQRQCRDVLCDMSIGIDRMMVCGGGGRSTLWRQMLADNYNEDIYRAAASDEGPALGVAILAAVGCGIYGSVAEACEKLIVPVKKNEVSADAYERYTPFYTMYCEAYPALKTIYAQMSAM